MNLDIYSANISALKQSQPALVEMLEGINIENQNECSVIEGMNGHNVLKVRKRNGDYILYNSFYNPIKEAKEITAHLDFSVNRSLFVSVGVGMGYHLLRILEKLNEKSILLSIEKNRYVLKTIFYYVDFSKAIESKKIFFVLGELEEKEELNNQIALWMSYLFINILKTQVQVLPILEIDYIRYCTYVLKYVADLRSNFQFTLGNSVDDTILGVDNNIKNLPHMIKNPGFNQFKDKYKGFYEGKPAIIIASGPSLDKNIHLLKEAQGKALLLACDGSMESLKKYNIIPDVVSSVERIMLTYEAFYKNKVMPDDTVLIAPAVVRPEIFETFNNKTLSLFKNESVGNFFNNMVYDKGVVFSGASVAHQLMGIATALGADPIVLVGQDLAYSKDGVSHVKEATVKEKVDVTNVPIYVKSNDGDDLPSTFVWKQFLKMYEEYIRANNINCINATEGGAYIEGTKVMSLEEVIKQFCTSELPNFRQLVDSLYVEKKYTFKAYDNSLKTLSKLHKRFLLLSEKCKKSKKMIREAQKLLKIGITTEEQLNQVYDTIDYTEFKVVKHVNKHPFLNMLFQYPIMVAVNQINELGTEITFDVLEKNLEIQDELLNTILYYNNKIIDVLILGIDFINSKAIENGIETRK